jgi:hypothetical protein
MVSTVVGWYCSCVVSQRSVRSRSLTIGEYVSTSFCAGLAAAWAPDAVSHSAAEAASIAPSRRDHVTVGTQRLTTRGWCPIPTSIPSPSP